MIRIVDAQYQIINNLLPWNNTNESSSNRDILLKTLIIIWFTFYTIKPAFAFCHFSRKYFKICTVRCFLAWRGVGGWWGFVCFSESYDWKSVSLHSPLFLLYTFLEPKSSFHLKCSLNKHTWNRYNELCLEMHEICTILIIFWEQMDLKITLKTLIRKVWLK